MLCAYHIAASVISPPPPPPAPPPPPPPVPLLVVESTPLLLPNPTQHPLSAPLRSVALGLRCAAHYRRDHVRLAMDVPLLDRSVPTRGSTSASAAT